MTPSLCSVRVESLFLGKSKGSKSTDGSRVGKGKGSEFHSAPITPIKKSNEIEEKPRNNAENPSDQPKIKVDGNSETSSSEKAKSPKKRASNKEAKPSNKEEKPSKRTERSKSTEAQTEDRPNTSRPGISSSHLVSRNSG